MKALRAMLFRDGHQVLFREANLLEPLPVRLEIRADAAHGIPGLAEQLEVVGDVARAPAELAAHLGNQERHVEHVQLVGKDVGAEAVREHHDGVVRNGSADECALLVLACHALLKS
jgi:hypothetical protein